MSELVDRYTCIDNIIMCDFT